MKQGTYVGSVVHLKGKTALLQEHCTRQEYCLAQFDDSTLTRSGKPLPKLSVLSYEPHARHPSEELVDYPEPPKDSLGFGWCVFHSSDFMLN